MKNLIGKILLFVFMTFTAHDYIVGQHDIVHAQEEVALEMSKCKQHALTEPIEHQIFHTLALFAADHNPYRYMFQDSPETSSAFHTSQTFHQPPYTPPKTV